MKPIVFYHVDGIFGIRGRFFFFRYLFLCFLSFFWVLFTDGACALCFRKRGLAGISAASSARLTDEALGLD